MSRRQRERREVAEFSLFAGDRPRPPKGEYTNRAIARIIFRMEIAMQADTPFELGDRLIALCPDKRATSIALNERATAPVDWIAGIVLATDDQAVHAHYWERHPELAGDEVLYLLEGRLSITLVTEGGSRSPTPSWAASPRRSGTRASSSPSSRSS
jgi:hypothetical protein